MLRRWFTRPRLRVGLAVALGSPLVAGLWLRLGPLPPGLLDVTATSSTMVVDRRGERLYEARSSLGLRGEWIDAADVPPAVAAATMAAEDERFGWHIGVDPIAITRAFWRNVRYGEIAEGGSTISQQVAKLLIAHGNGGLVARGWRAKAWEAVVALRLEHRLSKTAILGLYVNLAPYGNQIQGIGRAARAYFGRDLASLTTAETAFLAALPQQPSRFNPWRRPEAARPRQQRVLQRMAARGWIAASAHQAAMREHLTLTQETPAALAPHFVERVLASVAGQRPRRIVTTIDGRLQRTVHGILAAERAALDRHDASNVAVAVLDHRTGEWVAWEGSGNYFDARHGGAIDGVVSPRQPGSALKPFTYAAAFERGWSPNRVLADVPSEFPTAEPGVVYSPRNYDGRFRGPLLARAALAGSENVPAVVLASEIGVPAVARLLRQAGLSTLDQNAAHYGLGLTLGNAEIRLDELVTAYGMLARGGERIEPRLITAVDDRPSSPGRRERLLSERTAFWVTDILADNEARAYVFGRGGSLEFPFPVAVKTGTSQAYRDNWALGYTKDVTVGVWVGNFDRRPLRGSSGVTGAGPIFHSVMLAAVEWARGSLPIDDPTPIMAPPVDTVQRDVCELSGMVAGAACPVRRREWVPDGRPGDACEWHHATEAGVLTLWPAVYHAWARTHGLFDDRRTPVAGLAQLASSADEHHRPAPSRAVADPPVDRLAIARPLGGAMFLLDGTLRPEFQMLTFAARGGTPGPLEWRVNDEPAGVDTGEAPVRWAMRRGRHTIVVRDAAGREASARIEVR